MARLPRNTILVGDARRCLAALPSASIDCVITSPPYFQLRDFGVDGQLGLERTVAEWVANLRAVFSECARVLKPTGSVWLDLGDSYSRGPRDGAPVKGLLLAPERLLLTLAADGWTVRNKVIWAKRGPLPTPATDRLNATYDVVYFLVRSRRYFFDLDAIREPLEGTAKALGRNPGDVWRITPGRFAGPHFATFPTELVRQPLLATCPVRLCRRCGTPWQTRTTIRHIGQPIRFKKDDYIRHHPVRYRVIRENPRLEPSCHCSAPTQPGVVLDPFFGAGTVGLVAEQHGRDWIGIELNPEYAELARRRLEADRTTRSDQVPALVLETAA